AVMSGRALVGSVVATGVGAALQPASQAQTPPGARPVVIVNGQPHELPDDPRVTLLDLLRERLLLTGTKKGCDHGQCGACTVLVNGRRINSCLALAVAHAGDRVTTVEGLARDDALHPGPAAVPEPHALPVSFLHPG